MRITDMGRAGHLNVLGTVLQGLDSTLTTPAGNEDVALDVLFGWALTQRPHRPDVEVEPATSGSEARS